MKDEYEMLKQVQHDGNEESRQDAAPTFYKDWIPDSFWLMLHRWQDNKAYLQSARGDRLRAGLQSLFGNDRIKTKTKEKNPPSPILVQATLNR